MKTKLAKTVHAIEKLKSLKARNAELVKALTLIMANQEFDGGGHVAKLNPPTHSAALIGRAALLKCK